MKSFANIFSGILVVLLSMLSVSAVKAQDVDSVTVESDTTFLPMASGYDWITYRGKADIIAISFIKYRLKVAAQNNVKMIITQY